MNLEQIRISPELLGINKVNPVLLKVYLTFLAIEFK